MLGRACFGVRWLDAAFFLSVTVHGGRLGLASCAAGHRITLHETEVPLCPLRAVPGATESPASGARLPACQRRPTAGASGPRAQRLEHVLETSFVRYRQAAGAAAARGPSPAFHWRSARTPAPPAPAGSSGTAQWRFADVCRRDLPYLWPRLAAGIVAATRGATNRDRSGAAPHRGTSKLGGLVSALPADPLCGLAVRDREGRLGRSASDHADRVPQGGLPCVVLNDPQISA